MKNELLQIHDVFCQEAINQNYRKTTIRWWKESIRAFIRFYGNEGIHSVQHITLDRLRRYLFDGMNRGWTSDSFNSQRRSLNAFLKWCVFRGLLPENPLDQIPRQRLEKKLPKAVSMVDAQRILEYAFNARVHYEFQRYRNRALLAVMIFAGLRCAETLNLKMDHVDLVNGVIAVRNGKGGKDRLVPIHYSLASILKEYVDARKRRRRTCEYFFASAQEDRQLTYFAIRRLVRQVRDGTGIAFSAHRLRHTFATLMLEGECDLFSLKEMMGHSDIQTTSIYLSATTNKLKAQMSKHPMGFGGGYGESTGLQIQNIGQPYFARRR
ncbi:MAG: tyrosine-type recombinase/integrase [Deltaproteobacteria bacterium]|nr:tyrosine-type recombinase/integrase [Deltaproteobacteria bacterium]